MCNVSAISTAIDCLQIVESKPLVLCFFHTVDNIILPQYYCSNNRILILKAHSGFVYSNKMDIYILLTLTS